MESSRSGSATAASAPQSVGGGKTADFRRRSEPTHLSHTTLALGADGGGCAPLPCQNAHDRGVGPQHLQFNDSQKLRQQHQPHVNYGMNHHKNSYAGAIDLMTSSVLRTDVNHHAATHGDLFISSSHHTAHAHGAGDLLSMTRRNLDPSASDPNAQSTTKKRLLATLSTTGNEGMALGSQPGMVNQQEFPMQTRQTPEHHYFEQPTNSQIGHENNFDSAQVQTKRRCRRDESFEMDECI